jgi:hypothetical protein
VPKEFLKTRAGLAVTEQYSQPGALPSKPQKPSAQRPLKYEGGR